MVKFEKVICTTDFSEPSFRAVEYARVLATRFGAELTLMHVVDTVPVTTPPIGGVPMSTTLNVTEYQKRLSDSANAQLDKLVQKHSSEDLVVHKHITEGRPGDEIVQFARDTGADLIVIAAQGRNLIHRLVFGSVAERVMRSAPCPVMTIGAKDKD